MSDFDVDELDKAVNGALTTAPSSSDDSAVSETPVATPKEEVPVSSETPVVAPAARRSSGRFMDVVHPSSDMRTRQSPAIVAPLEAPSTDQTTPSPSVASDVTTSTTPPTEADGVDWQAPLESPFLPDAKVEKRPLGDSKPTGEIVPPSVSDKNDSSDVSEPDTHTMPDPLDFMVDQQHDEATEEVPAATPAEAPKETALPLDLSAELNESPADESNADDLHAASEAPAEPAELPMEAGETKEKVESPDQTESHIAALEEQPIGPTSITQQYQEQPSSTQASGAIYDTEAYHQPLAHPEKKRSSW